MKRFIVSAIAMAAFATAGQAQSAIVGDWQGALDTGESEVHLVLHVTKDADGKLKATMDSQDQGVSGIALSDVAVDGKKVSFKVTAVNGSYAGFLNADESTIAGTWSQGADLALDFKKSAVPIPPPAPRQMTPVPVTAAGVKASDIDGAWAGALDVNGTKLHLVFHVASTATGLTATMDSPDQGANGFPVTSAVRTGDSVTFELKQISGAFTGTISKDRSTITGTWTQGGHEMPLELKMVKS